MLSAPGDSSIISGNLSAGNATSTMTGSEDKDDNEAAKVTNGQEEGRTAAGCGEVQKTGARGGAPSATTGGKVFCDVDNCIKST